MVIDGWGIKTCNNFSATVWELQHGLSLCGRVGRPGIALQSGTAAGVCQENGQYLKLLLMWRGRSKCAKVSRDFSSGIGNGSVANRRKCAWRRVSATRDG